MIKTIWTNEKFPTPAFGGDKVIVGLLQEAIENELTEIQRNTLLAFWYNDKKIREIACTEQVSEQQVRRRLQQCYKKLRTALQYAVRYSQLRGFFEEAA